MESIHEQVGFPPFINLSDIMTDEHEVVGSHRFAQHSHLRLFGGTVTFAVIAFDTGSYKVLPRFFSRLRFGHHVVDGERYITPAAVLATVTIPTKYVLARKNDFLVRNLDVDTEPHNAWERHAHGYGAHPLALMCFDEFRFPEIQQHDRFLHIANRHRLIILIEDEHFAVEGTPQTMLIVITEDSILSFGQYLIPVLLQNIG